MLLALAVAALVLLPAGIWVAGCALSGPRHQGPVSDHFDGRRFSNQRATGHAGFPAFVRWMMDRDPGPWRDWTEAAPGPAPPPLVPDGRMRVTWVNHATVLLQMDGLNILTDPIWSERASPFPWIGPRRVRPPGVRFEDLPPIDLVLISHNHYDHLDLPTLRRLAAAHHPRFVVGLGNGALLTRAGIPGVVELDWWQSLDPAPGIVVTAVPAQHFSSRGFCDRDATLWAGYVIEGPAGAAYFAGDTGFGPHFGQIRQRFGPVRLAMLPIGAFRPEWFMARAHLSPADAVRAHRALGAHTSLAIHYGTFRLGDDGQEEAPRRLREALAAAPAPRPRFWLLEFGEEREVPPPEAAATPPTAVPGRG